MLKTDIHRWRSRSWKPGFRPKEQLSFIYLNELASSYLHLGLDLLKIMDYISLGALFILQERASISQYLLLHQPGKGITRFELDDFIK